ncbi:MAG TPA: HEAT repeat domain-containing protein [Planctomycetota bacterium]|nr:HEAT repeat domain-containing protein [Planctomycetota bacterium]
MRSFRLAVAVLLLLPAAAPIVAAQTGSAPKDDRKEVATLVTDLGKDVTAKKDDDAVGKIDQLVKEFASSGPKDKKKIADAIVKALKANRLIPEGSKEQPKLFVAAVTALGQLGEFGAPPLKEAFEAKDWKKDLAFRGKILKQLGTTKSPSAVDFLLEVYNHKDYELVADAAAALGSYSSAPEEIRKRIVEKTTKHLNTAAGSAADFQDPNYSEFKRKYETISPAMIETLQKLTNQTFREPREWEKWWNEHKSKPWTT